MYEDNDDFKEQSVFISENCTVNCTASEKAELNFVKLSSKEYINYEAWCNLYDKIMGDTVKFTDTESYLSLVSDAIEQKCKAEILWVKTASKLLRQIKGE